MAEAPDAKRPKLEDAAEAEEEEQVDEEADEELAPEDAVVGDAINSDLFERLDTIQAELDKINEEAHDKVLQVEQEYNHLRRPVYERRRAVVNQIPDFWRKTLMAHPIVSGYINDVDEEIMGHLLEVEVEDFEDMKSGFQITFRFASEENPYFSDAALTKNFYYLEEGLKTTSTPPHWREGMEPRNEEEEAPEDAGKPDPGLGPIVRFFTWFVEEEMHNLGNHDELADVIKDDIWPNPFRYYQSADLPVDEEESPSDELPGDWEEGAPQAQDEEDEDGVEREGLGEEEEEEEMMGEEGDVGHEEEEDGEPEAEPEPEGDDAGAPAGQE